VEPSITYLRFMAPDMALSGQRMRAIWLGLFYVLLAPHMALHTSGTRCQPLEGL
jgi:hypothetical protein